MISCVLLKFEIILKKNTKLQSLCTRFTLNHKSHKRFLFKFVAFAVKFFVMYKI